MTPDELADFLKWTGIDTRSLSNLMGGDGDNKLVWRWSIGDRIMPADVSDWLDEFLRWLEANPPPNIAGRAGVQIPNTPRHAERSRSPTPADPWADEGG